MDALLNDPNRCFWSEVHRSIGPRTLTSAPVVYGVSGSENITKLWCSSFKQLYNSSDGSASTNLLKTLDSDISFEDINIFTNHQGSHRQAEVW